MSNQRSVMTEFRSLDQKRLTEGLTSAEATRYAQLREQVGPETTGAPRSGFDVNAAAARLRESLLPAGLRSRPAGLEAPPPAAAAPPEPVAPPEALALEQAWADAPFADLAAAPAEALFEPGSLAQEVRPQAWNPEAPGYDPDAPYDEAAWIAAGYDPTATYDWSASGYGPDGQPLAADAAPAPEAAPEAGQEIGQAWDAAPPVEESWAQGVGPVDAPFQAEPLLGEPALAGPLPAVEEALPFDPNAPFDHAKWFGRRAAPAADPAPEPALDLEPLLEALPAEPLEALVEPETGLVAAEPDLAFDLAGEPAVPEPPAFGEYDEATTPPLAAPLEVAEPEPAAPASAEPQPPTEEAPVAWLDDSAPAPHQPAPADAPFGVYDEAGATAAPLSEGALEALLPFDLAAASAIEAGAMPEGYEPGGPALDPGTLPPVELGGYDDPSAYPAGDLYGGPEGDSLPGGAPLELGALAPEWQPDAALEQGFELASDGSFGHAEIPVDRRTPAWGTPLPVAPADAWESAPALDLAGPFEEPPAVSPAQPLADWSPAVEPVAEELPTIEGAELLEELPPEGGAPYLELAEPAEGFAEAAGASPLDGAFEESAAVEAAAYPPPDLSADFAAAEPEAPLADPTLLEPEADPAATPAWAEPLAGAEAAGVPAWAEPLPEASPAWEPEPAVSYEPAPGDAGSEALPPEIAAAYGEPGATGDTFELPPAVAAGLFAEPPAPEPQPEEAEVLAPAAPAVLIEGSHRVVLHTVDGQVKRGLLVDALLDAPELPLQPQGPGTAELIPADAIKAIFFMLAPNEKAPAPVGKKVRVTFRDGRQVAGYSPDYQEGLVGFFMIPADTRTNTGRIWVYQAAVKQVAVS